MGEKLSVFSLKFSVGKELSVFSLKFEVGEKESSVFQSILRICLNLCNLWMEGVFSLKFSENRNSVMKVFES